jgi:predicted CopG family antitoxin
MEGGIRMEEAKTIKISPKVYAELNIFKELLSTRLKRHVSINDALEDLLSRADRKKPSDFAGAWVMSDEEEKEIKESLRELWRTWKVD